MLFRNNSLVRIGRVSTGRWKTLSFYRKHTCTDPCRYTQSSPIHWSSNQYHYHTVRYDIMYYTYILWRLRVWFSSIIKAKLQTSCCHFRYPFDVYVCAIHAFMRELWFIYIGIGSCQLSHKYWWLCHELLGRFELFLHLYQHFGIMCDLCLSKSVDICKHIMRLCAYVFGQVCIENMVSHNLATIFRPNETCSFFLIQTRM